MKVWTWALKNGKKLDKWPSCGGRWQVREEDGWRGQGTCGKDAHVSLEVSEYRIGWGGYKRCGDGEMRDRRGGLSPAETAGSRPRGGADVALNQETSFDQRGECEHSGRASLLSKRSQTSQIKGFSFGLNATASMTTCLKVPFVKLHPLLRQQS